MANLTRNSQIEWKHAGTLRKVSDFRVTEKQGPIEYLHLRIRNLLPDVENISQVGVSRRTNKYLESKLMEYARKHFPEYTRKAHRKMVAWTMLDSSPCTVEGVEDFQLYVRVGK